MYHLLDVADENILLNVEVEYFQNLGRRKVSSACTEKIGKQPQGCDFLDPVDSTS